MGNFSNFLGGFMEQQGRQQDAKDKMDRFYQQEHTKADYAEQINSAKEEADQAKQIAVNKAKKEQGPYGNSALGQQLSDVISGGSGNQINPQAAPGAVPTPQANAMPVGPDDAPIAPRTAPMQVAQTQAPTAMPSTSGGGLDSPQGGNVPLSSDQGPASPTTQKLPTAGDISSSTANAPSTPASATQIGQSITDAEKQIHIGAGLHDPEAMAFMHYEIAAGNPLDTKTVEKAFDIQSKNAKEGAKGAPSLDSYGSNDQQYITAAKGAGVIKDESQLKPLPDREVNARDKMLIDAGNARSSGIQAVNTLNSIFSINSDVEGGPGTSTLAKVSASIDKMTDQEVAKKINSVYMMDKDNKILSNSTMKGIGTSRPGIGLVQFESAANPSSDMPEEARKLVAKQIYAQQLANINHADIIINAPDNMTPGDRIKMAIRHDDDNPALLKDGSTLNPNFVDANTWLQQQATNTRPKGGATGQDIRSVGNANSQGQEPTKGPIAVNSTDAYNKVPVGQQYTDPQGNIRTKK